MYGKSSPRYDETLKKSGWMRCASHSELAKLSTCLAFADAAPRIFAFRALPPRSFDHRICIRAARLFALAQHLRGRYIQAS